MQADIFLNIELAKNGDKEAQAIIVEENSGLIWSVVRRFLGRGHDAEDLFQVGAIGLMKAIQKFDTSFDVKFSTYAVPMIMGEIMRFMRDDGIIKVSRSLKELAAKAKAARESLIKTLGRDPYVSEIAESLGVDTAELVVALDAVGTPESLSSIQGDDDRQLIDKIDQGSDTESEIIDKIAIKEALSQLKPRERQIIIMRYFQQKTQTQIAKMLGISQVQVSRIEKKVLGEMRKKISM